jgi:hypothetical protein
VAILGIAEHPVHGKVQVWIHHDGGGDYILGNIFHNVLFEGHRAPYGIHLYVQILLIVCILHLVHRLWHDLLYLFDVSGDTTGSGSRGTRGSSSGGGGGGGGTDGWGDHSGGKGHSGSGKDGKGRGRYGNIKMNNYFVFTICQKSIKGDLLLLLRVILEDD